MLTFYQATTVQRGRHAAIPSPVGARALFRQFPVPGGSAQALLRKMYATGAEADAWAVILCRFKGAAPDAGVEGPIETFFRGAFTPYTQGLVEYWRDASLGAVDISGSRVFGWVELDVARIDAGIGSGENRSTLVDRAIAAVKRAGGDAETGFHSQIAVLTSQWAKDGAPPGSDYNTPVWGPFFIDGSTDGRGKTTLTPPFDGDVTAHEMGHGFGMNHDVAADQVKHYADPCCIMSQQNAFLDPTWNVAFGPALCLPHLMQRGWMPDGRLFRDGGGWAQATTDVYHDLAPLSDPDPRYPLGLVLTVPGLGWDYLVEYIRPTQWDAGLPKDTVFVRRIGPGKDVGDTPLYLASQAVPDLVGRSPMVFKEVTGDTFFKIFRGADGGRTVRVAARKA